MAVVEELPFGIVGPVLRGRASTSFGTVPCICCTRRMLLLGVLNRDVEDEMLRRLLEIPLCDKSANDRDGTRSRGR